MLLLFGPSSLAYVAVGLWRALCNVENCFWEGHSNLIVDKSSLRSALALLLMQVNTHLNGSCSSSDLKTGGKRKRAAGGQHLNVNISFAMPV